MKIRNIETLKTYLINNSGFAESTINNVILTLGYPLKGVNIAFNELSTQFVDCAEHGADIGISGFIYYSETIPFFMENRRDIVKHMEQTAAELGTDIISMVQGFGTFRNSDKPTPSEIGRALWDSGNQWEDLTNLYNVFSWYTLEENPTYRVSLSA
jgi:hypothetical protein